MTIASELSPISLTQFFYQSGKLVRPARLFFYKPNTEDAVTVYSEPTLGRAYAQPVLTGGSGRVPPIYVGEEPYRIRVFDSFGALIEDIEYLPGAVAPVTAGAPGSPVPGTVLQTGDMFVAFAAPTTARTGCVRANGGLIGPATFDASAYTGQVERLNVDTQALFTWLWGQDVVNALAVIPSKGSSAANDWAANKAIRLPDLRGRALVGVDGMGLPYTGRLNGVTISPLNAGYSGAGGGSALETMTEAQMPAHTHVVNKATTGIVITPASAAVTLHETQHVHFYTGIGFTTPGPYDIASGTHGLVELSTTATSTNITISEPPGGHNHTLIEPGGVGHDHTMIAKGGGQSMEIMPPFALAIIYIKL